METKEAIGKLNEIMELELAGVVRYTHYSLMVYGCNRSPIVEWMRKQAHEFLNHVQEAGELITHFGKYPSLKIGPLLETEKFVSLWSMKGRRWKTTMNSLWIRCCVIAVAGRT